MVGLTFNFSWSQNVLSRDFWNLPRYRPFNHGRIISGNMCTRPTNLSAQNLPRQKCHVTDCFHCQSQFSSSTWKFFCTRLLKYKIIFICDARKCKKNFKPPRTPFPRFTYALIRSWFQLTLTTLHGNRPVTKLTCLGISSPVAPRNG